MSRSSDEPMSRSCGASAPPLAIAAVSFGTLLLELALTRLFSVVLFYHFAFLAISIALLGLGAGGVFAFIWKQKLDAMPLRPLAVKLTLASSVAIVVALEVLLHVPVSLNLTGGNFLRLTAIYLASAVPFFFTGLLFSAVFAREPERIGQFYGADLIGGAAACLAVVPLLNWIGGPNAIVFAALAMAAAAWMWNPKNLPQRLKPSEIQPDNCRPEGLLHPSGGRSQWSRAVVAGFIAAYVILIAANVLLRGKLIDIIYAKGMRRDQPWVEFAKWNAISRVEVDRQGDAKVIVIDADASTYIMGADPARWEEQPPQPTQNRRALGTPESYKKNLMSAAPAVVNVLRPHGDYAIIGPGGGVDVMRALANGSKNVTAIEINPIIANDIMRGRYADYAYHLYQRPEVHLHVQDGRSFIRNSKDKYDVIQMTLVDTWASTAAGAFALSENNLYTVEAFKEYFDHLKPDGMIAITRWEFKEPREALRVVSQGIEALKEMGVESSSRNFLIVSDGDLNADGRPVAVLIKKAPFSEEEEERVLDHVRTNPNLFPIYTPFIYSCPMEHCIVEALPPYKLLEHSRHVKDGVSEPFVKLITAEPDSQLRLSRLEPALKFSPREDWVASYAYEIAPVYDNAPFFFFTFKTRGLINQLLHPHSDVEGIDWKVNLGVAVLFMLLAISFVAVLAFLILPLWLHAPARGVKMAPLIYFIAVGLGYILVEITLIQRFVLFLGHPTYALTVVIFLMLLASGAGSLFARRWITRWREVLSPLAIVVTILLIYWLVLPPLLAALVGLAFALKLAMSFVLLAPLGFAMGMPFPTGLRALNAGTNGSIEWAWAMNAAASVLGSVGAMVIAIHFGLGVTLLCATGSYVAAAILTRAFDATAISPPLADLIES